MPVNIESGNETESAITTESTSGPIEEDSENVSSASVKDQDSVPPDSGQESENTIPSGDAR